MNRNVKFGSVYLIIAGITLLLNNVFHLRFNMFWVLVAEALILLGIFSLLGSSRQFTATSSGREQLVLFNSTHIVGNPETAKYTVLFSSAVIEMPYTPQPITEINALFSDVRIAVAPGHVTRVRLTATFGASSMPGANISGFGEREYALGVGDGPAVYMSANAVFGNLIVQ